MAVESSLVSFPVSTCLEGAGDDLVPLTELVTANRQRDALYRLSEQLARAVSSDSIYSAALAAIENALDCDRSSILLFDAAKSMQFVAWHGLSDAYRAAVAGHSPWAHGEQDATPIGIADIASAELDATLKRTILGEDIHAAAFIPLIVDRGLIGKFMAYFRAPRTLTREDLNVAMTIARQLGFAIQRQRTDAEIAAELAVTRALQALSIESAHAADLGALYDKLLDAAMLIMQSDLSSMQEYHAERGPRGELHLLATRNFTPAACRLWSRVHMGSTCACGIAYRSLSRVVVPDVENSDPPAQRAELEGYRETGIRSVQSTPLVARSGELVGMISTHWREPHVPSERDLRLFDILARLAADLIERKKRDEDLARREERSRTLTQLLTDVPWHARGDGAFGVLQPAWENYTGQNWDSHSGHGWFDALHAEDRDAVRAAWAGACFDSQPFEGRARVWHAPSGEYRLCVIRATPIRNDDGSVREWVGACLDVQGQRVR